MDVGLHREDVSIACEISVSSTPSYEAKNLAKCLQAGFARVFAIAANAKSLKAIETAARERLSAEEVARISFLMPEHIPAALDQFAAPQEEHATVRGYRVKVSRSGVAADDAMARRAAVARVLAKSMANRG